MAGGLFWPPLQWPFMWPALFSMGLPLLYGDFERKVIPVREPGRNDPPYGTDGRGDSYYAIS